jgi:hypothetical protein
MSAEKKIYDEIDGAFDQMVDGNDGRKISGVELINREVESVEMQRERLKDRVVKAITNRESNLYAKQISILSATIAELTYEAVHDKAEEQSFYEKFRQILEKKNKKTISQEIAPIEKQLEEWLAQQKLPLENPEGEIEMWDFKACMLNSAFIKPTITLTRPDRAYLQTVGLYEIMKNLGKVNLDWDD